jgi:transposase InsO family protein
MKFNQLQTELAPRTRQKEFARAVDVTARTVRGWRGRLKPGDFPKLGRPAQDERAHRNAFWRVGREYLRQERCGWRPIDTRLGDAVPTRLVQTYVRVFKHCERRHERRRIQSGRTRVEVLAKNALWVQDSAQVGRQADGTKIETQLIKDRGPIVTVGISTGGPTRARDSVGLLAALKQERGLPLVLGTDNGAPFTAQEVETYLEREQVIHLKSLAYTPEHNGAAEALVGETRRGSQLSPATQIEIEAAHARVVRTNLRLNKNRIRMSKGLKTGAELDETLPVGYHQVDRAQFYQECKMRMEEAKLRVQGQRARRMAEREAILSTLERFGLVKRYQGGSQTTKKAEIFS